MVAPLEQSLKSLSISSDTNAQIFALLDQDKFHEALKAAQSQEAKNVSRLYIAYAQYRIGYEEDCLKTLGDARDRASRHLRAQALYRLERATVSDLSPLKTDTVVENEAADIEVNELAIAAQNAALSKSVETISVPGSASHESLFNYSIMLAFSGRTEEAIKSLEVALENLQALTLPEDEYDSEVAPILAQMAHLKGDGAPNADARAKDTDSSTKYMTGINFCEHDNPYAVFKAYQAETRLRPSARLFSYQDRFIAYDKIVAMSAIGLGIKKAVRRYLAQYAEIDPERCSALNSLMFSKATTQSLKSRIEANPRDVDAAVALISKTIRSRQGVSKAISIIEQIPTDVRNQHPGLIGAWAALSDLTPNPQSQSIIEAALSVAQDNVREELLAGAIQLSLAKSSGDASSDSGLRNRAKELLSLNPTNMIAQSFQSIVDSQGTNEIMQLPDLSTIDVVSLELGTKRALDTEAPKRQVKRVKTKTPEQLEAASKLDPERWLPKRDRSNYKPTKKDKLKSAGGHQGGIVDDSSPATQQAAQTTKASDGPRKKKNKKGKK